MSKKVGSWQAALQPDRAEPFDELLDTERTPVREKVVQFAQSLVDHEQEAVSFLSYETQLVLRLLQTLAAGTAACGALHPAGEHSAAADRQP
ncbi:hypothetical protein ACIP2Y_33730 [Streptomyces sviceus]|uniref:hypothetical protein n=1 Tax=Streptomyces sviceus TaxID=285530 RepID=UPI0037F413BF